ncbi:nuclear transport factor 2 family protein [Bradyrhizobium sp. RDM12]
MAQQRRRRRPTPSVHSETERLFVRGDTSFSTFTRFREPGTKGNAIVDIFKLEDGKIVEHWDVVQPIPDNPANNNMIF